MDGTKTCPMCAEDVKLAAVVCRFCGHSFEAGSSEQTVPPKPQGPPPQSITSRLRPDETLLAWSPCLLNYAHGTVAITTDRLLFFTVGSAPIVDHPLNADRKVSLGMSPTRPASCHPDGTIVIEFADERDDFHGLNPDIAREIGATIVPDLIDQLFDGDPDMQQRLRERQQKIADRLPALAAKPATASATVRGCRYLGGLSQLRDGRNVTLVFRPDAITVREMMNTIFTISQPQRTAVAIQGAEQLQQRLSATRLATLGVLAIAAPKRTRTAVSYITLTVSSGETGIFEIKDTDPMRLQARLSPWLAEH